MCLLVLPVDYFRKIEKIMKYIKSRAEYLCYLYYVVCFMAQQVLLTLSMLNIQKIYVFTYMIGT